MEKVNILQIVINYLIPVVLGSILGFLTTKLKESKKKNREKEEKQQKKLETLENGVQALLRNELIKGYREYEEKGEITILDKENITHMFEEYKNLGGNGTVKSMFEDLLELPTKIVK